MKHKSGNLAMPDQWNEMLIKSSKEELDELKLWLFKENIRLSVEKNEIEDSYSRFLSEQKQFRQEMKSINHKMEFERKRLQDEQKLFLKKQMILENAFRQLDVDRRNMERERKLLETERTKSRHDTSFQSVGVTVEKMFFRGVNSTLALKKRYKDLMKIFHPDNLCGDTETVKEINSEYEKLRSVFEYGK